MKCKYCKKTVDNDSFFCKYCGYKFIKDATEVSVPKPRKNKDGSFYAQIMKNGERVVIRGSTEDEYKANARLFKQGLYMPETPNVEEHEVDIVTLEEVMWAYVNKNENIFAKPTLRSYMNCIHKHFSDCMLCDYRVIDYQMMVNLDAADYKPKTLKSNWGYVKTALTDYGFTVPHVNLPRVPPKENTAFDEEELNKFLNALRGEKIEAAALLALHGLRLEELCALDAEDIHGGYIHIYKSLVEDYTNKEVLVHINKTNASTRNVPVMIQRLLEVLPSSGRIVTCRRNTVYRAIDSVCDKAGLHHTGTHGLRKTFASIAHHSGISDKSIAKLGGWADSQTMHRVYFQLSDKQADEDAKKIGEILSNY